MRISKEEWLKKLETGERSYGSFREQRDGVDYCCALGWGLLCLPESEQAWERSKAWARGNTSAPIAWKYWVNDLKSTTIGNYAIAAIALDIPVDQAAKIMDLSDSVNLQAAAEYIRNNL